MRKSIFVLICLLGCRFAAAQISPEKLVHEMDSLARTKPATLVYLQTSKGIYERGEEIWLKAYIMDSQLLAPTVEDSTVFIQLLKADGDNVVLQEQLPVDNGFASGHLFIKNTIPPGNYLVAAFTPRSFRSGPGEFKAFRRVRIMNRNDAAITSPTHRGDTLRIGFFPEGGNLVAGITNSVAFQVSSPDGRLAEIRAMLFENDRPIANLESAHRGMGKFRFVPQPSAHYFVKIAGSDQRFDLPPPMKEGVVFRLLQHTGKHFVFLVTKSNSIPFRKLYVAAQMRGKVYALYQGEMKDDSLTFSLPADKLPQGVAEVTLYNEALQPLAERLVYANPDRNLNIRTTLSPGTNHTKDRVRLDIKVTDPAGTPVVAHLGLSIFDSYYENPADRLNIVSYTRLFSQIKGKLHNPDYYFDPKNKDRHQALDLVLLTQGWRRYIWSAEELKKPAEGKIMLSNMLSGTVKSKTSLPTMLLPVNMSGSGLLHPILVYGSGSFTLGQETMLMGRLYIKPLGDEETAKAAKLAFNEPFKIVGDILRQKSVTGADFTEIPRPAAYRPELSGSISLDEMVVKGKGKNYTDRYMATLDSIARFDWNTDYVGVCQWLNCATCGHGTKPVEGVAYSRFKDGRPPQHGAFKSEDVIKEPYRYPTYTEDELMAKFNLYRVDGYQRPKEFYQPDYDHEPAEKLLTDSRTTLIWNPAIITNENGEASVSFYCSDVTGAFTGKIEGLDVSGNSGYSEFGVTVTEKAQERSD